MRPLTKADVADMIAAGIGVLQLEAADNADEDGGTKLGGAHDAAARIERTGYTSGKSVVHLTDETGRVFNVTVSIARARR